MSLYKFKNFHDGSNIFINVDNISHATTGRSRVHGECVNITMIDGYKISVYAYDFIELINYFKVK